MKQAFRDWSMSNTNLILKGIKVKWARKLEYNKILSLDARIQIVSKRKNKPASYVVTNNENLCITPKNILNTTKRSTIWMASRNKFTVSIKPWMFSIGGLAYGVRNNVVRVIRNPYKFAINKRGLYSSEKIYLHKKTHSYASTKEPLVTEVNNIGEYKSSENSTHMTVKKISYSEICDIESLKRGLTHIKRSKSPGVYGLTKANISLERLKKLQKDLITQKYKPKPNKKVPIPKLGRGTRYIGIASVIDKIIQATILILLIPIVDPFFYENSYGFRPNRGCHDALRHIKLKWQNVTWTINVDIEKCFDKIHHDLLLEYLKSYMDQSCVELIGKLCKAG